jgi:hypothetical protein
MNTTQLSAEDKQMHQAFQQSLKDHFSEVQAQSRKVAMLNKIVATGDPRDPDYKWLLQVDPKTKQPNIRVERQKLLDQEQEYIQWRKKTVAPWYAKRGLDLVDPNKGTSLGEHTFEPSNE